MPLPTGMGGFGAGGADGAAGWAAGAGGTGGVVAGGAAASATRSGPGAGAVVGSVAGAAGVVVGGSAAGEGGGGTSLKVSPPERAAAVSSFAGEPDGRPRAVATPTASTRSEAIRTWRWRGRPERMRRGMARLLSG